MKTIIVNEGSIKLKIPKAEKISKKMCVFYNPVMSLNRDVSVLLLNSINKNNLQIADPLAATGVRSIRFLKELNKNKIKKIYINDYDKSAIKLIKQNFALNKINYKNNTSETNKIKDFMVQKIPKEFSRNRRFSWQRKSKGFSPGIIIQNQDANLFLLNSTGFDYIDIDPFGAPIQFLDSACKRLARNGILAVTATDTSALCGTAPMACIRKYWAMPRKDAIMHETGLRILIRKIQLVAAQYEKALTPIFSYSKEHYMRVFLRNIKGKNEVNKILKRHDFFNESGPMWLGNLWNKTLVDKMYKNVIENKIFNINKELINFLKIIKEESKINIAGFYDLHDICEKNKIKRLLKKYVIINKMKKLGYKASETHFKGEGVKSNISIDKLVNLIKNK